MEPRTSASDTRLRGDAPAVHGLVLAAAFVALFAWTWGRWPDPWVDFGRELYVPWRLASGDVLGRDIAWFNGPLSQSWNAVLFRLFGVGLTTLVWANTALFAVILTLLHSLLRDFASRWAATVACLVVMATCGFGQLVAIGNYNYVTPYSHEVTHGLALGLAALVLARRTATAADVGGARRGAFLCGVVVGLSFLTKPEVFVAAAAGAVASLGASAWSARLAWRRWLWPWVAGIAVPIAVAWLAFLPPLGAAAAGRLTLGAWSGLWSTSVASSPFYRAILGVDRPLQNLREMAIAASWMGLLVAPGLLCAGLARKVRSQRALRILRITVVAATAVLLAVTASRIPWLRLARPWPVLVAATLAVAARRLRGRGEGSGAPAAIGFAVFALAMLAKMALNARLPHYGFVLALPATAMLVAVAWSWIGDWIGGWIGQGIEATAGDAVTWRSALALALAAFAGAHLATTARTHAAKTVEVGAGRDHFWADARGAILRDVVASLAPSDGPTPTVVALPEGVMANYLARARNPTPYVNFMPPELELFGEERMLAALREHPPELVLVTHKNTAEYGAPWFGRDYGQDLGRWIDGAYEARAVIGDPPLVPGSRFGVAVLKRRIPGTNP
jgi:hypothetical protein